MLSLGGSVSGFERRFGYQGYAALDTQLIGVNVHLSTQRTFQSYEDLGSVLWGKRLRLLDKGGAPSVHGARLVNCGLILTSLCKASDSAWYGQSRMRVRFPRLAGIPFYQSSIVLRAIAC